MKVTFIGATHEVTGSCTLIEACGKNILVDCGMEQGKDLFENQQLPVNPSAIDCVLLTHAHIDHSGNLPLLYKNGFTGNVYATRETCNLARIMLLDSAHIQQFEAEWRNRKAQRSGEPPYEPIYDMEDAQGLIEKLVECHYGKRFSLYDGIEIRFTDIGHLLGSASIEIWLTEQQTTKKVVFSGDVGNLHQPILKDPQPTHQADYVVIESTYGDKTHGPRPDYIQTLTEYIQQTFDNGGNVVIPAFAVGRTQELLYFLRQIKAEHKIKGHDGFKVYVDSPLANEATKIFMNCGIEYLDEEASKLVQAGINPITFDGLITSESSEDSKAINFDPDPKVIISASGMCEAGRIRHHLKHNLWRPECLILFVGYQAVGTLGRSLFEGAKKVKLFGETIHVNARIEYLPGISGHADKDGLTAWIKNFKEKPQKVFVNHGDDEICESFAAYLKDSLGFDTLAPYSGTCYDLLADVPTQLTQGIPVVKAKPESSRNQQLYQTLVSAAEKLLAAAKKCEGYPNKEIAGYTSQIEELCRKIQR